MSLIVRLWKKIFPPKPVIVLTEEQLIERRIDRIEKEIAEELKRIRARKKKR